MKRVLSLVFALVMVFSTVLIAVPETKADAVTTTTFQTVKNYYYAGNPTKMCGDKVGSYYFAVKLSKDPSTGKYYYYLVATTSASTKAKVLLKVSADKLTVDSTLLTNGDKVFFCVRSSTSKTATCYKYTVSTKKYEKVFSADRMVNVCAYYNGRIYYTVSSTGKLYDTNTFSLYRYNVSTKNKAKTTATFFGTSGYGPYIAGTTKYTDSATVPVLLYKATDNTKTKVGTGMCPVVTSNRVIYLQSEYSGRRFIYTAKRTTFTGKTTSTVATGIYPFPDAVGRKGVYFGTQPNKIFP